MATIARASLDDENFGLDATLQQGQIGRNDSIQTKVEITRSVMKPAGSVAGGLKSPAKMAVAGDRALKAADYAVHYLANGVDQASADANANAAAIRAIGSRYGTEIANTVPTIVRGMPFAPLTNSLGPKGERWVPMHGLFPHHAVGGFHDAIMADRAEHADAMIDQGIHTGTMFMAIGSTAFVYEPTYYWPDARDIVQERMAPAEHLATLSSYQALPEAAEIVAKLKHGVIDLMFEHGTAHPQIGKTYPYLRDRNAASVALLHAI